MDKRRTSSEAWAQYVATEPDRNLCEFDGVRTDGETGRTVARYDRERVSLGVAIPTLVAERSGLDPVALPPLYDCIDVDALEAAVGDERRAGSDIRVRFEYAGYVVTASDSRLTVEPVE